MTNFDSAKHPRGHTSNKGSFSEKPNTAPEVSAQVMASLGLGPHSDNLFASSWDTAGFGRPMRSTLPLCSADDDEFFDAPDGTVLNIAGEHASRIKHRRTGSVWTSIDDGSTLSPGELWLSLFDQEGKMSSSELLLPAGMFHSDQTFFRPAAIAPRTVAWAKQVFASGRGRMVSLTGYDENGDAVGSGIPDRDGEAVDVSFTDYRSIKCGGPTEHSFRELYLSDVTLAERDGDLVVRSPGSDGRFYELVYRAT